MFLGEAQRQDEQVDEYLGSFEPDNNKPLYQDGWVMGEMRCRRTSSISYGRCETSAVSCGTREVLGSRTLGMRTMYGHTYTKSMDQPGKFASPPRGQLNREN